MTIIKKLSEKIFPLGIPLAWLQLTSERKRFCAAIAGITFAVTMMLFQMGLQAALFRQVVAPISLLNGEIMIVGPNYEYFGVGRGFPIVRLHQAGALDELDYATPLKLGCMPFKNVDNGLERDIFVIAYDPSHNLFLSNDIQIANDSLKEDGVIMFDKLSRPQYGNVIDAMKKYGTVKTEMSGKMCTIDNLVEIGPTFAADGNILMSLSTFSDIWKSTPNVVNVGVLKLKNGADVQNCVEKLKKILPSDVTVMSKKDFISNEQDYWAVRTPIGFVITASMIVSIFVGAIIVYQILYTDVTDHLKEYATLKAIGFDDKFFVNVILQESIILSLIGFIPGSILAAILYWLTRTMAGMPTYLSITNLIIVLALSITMCMIAGMLATRKLRHANPADIF